MNILSPISVGNVVGLFCVQVIVSCLALTLIVHLEEDSEYIKKRPILNILLDLFGYVYCCGFTIFLVVALILLTCDVNSLHLKDIAKFLVLKNSIILTCISDKTGKNDKECDAMSCLKFISITLIILETLFILANWVLK